jgi:hypothetical protein
VSVPDADVAVVVWILFLDDFFAVADLFGVAATFESLIDQDSLLHLAALHRRSRKCVTSSCLSL